MSRCFDIAWFFHVSPSEVLGLPIDELLLWEREALRIKRQREGAR